MRNGKSTLALVGWALLCIAATPFVVIGKLLRMR